MKKIILCLLCAVLLFSVAATPVLACPQKQGFTCWLLEIEVPEGTAYVDMLLPLGASDEGYTAYNQQNGEKYGIAADSQIVQYSVDGYQSYAFHMQNACPSLVPLQICKITMPRELFVEEIKKDTLFSMENYAYQTSLDPKAVEKELIVADKRYPYTSDEKAKLDAFCLEYQLVAQYDPYLYLNYCVLGEDGKSGSFDAYAQKYMYAKLAYLDAEGNVLAVTEAGKLHHDGLFLDKKTVLTAYGTFIEEEISHTMSAFCYDCIGVAFGLVVVAFGVFFVMGARKIILRGKKAKESEAK